MRRGRETKLSVVGDGRKVVVVVVVVDGRVCLSLAFALYASLCLITGCLCLAGSGAPSPACREVWERSCSRRPTDCNNADL